MASKSRPITLFESVMWGTSKQVQEILDQRDLTFDDNWTDYALLLTALRRKRKEIAKILINKGCRTQKIPKTDVSDTPLHYAVKMGDITITQMLLLKGVSATDLDKHGETPLCAAMKMKNYTLVDLIFDSTSNISSFNTTNNDGFSHFHIACMRNNVNVVENFLKSTININDSINFTAKEWPGYTALHLAVEYDCLDTVKLLLDHNADINIKNADDKTPLHLAVQKQNDSIANLILSSHKVQNYNPMDSNGFSHFHIACMQNNLTAVNNFLQQGIAINQAVNMESPIWPGYTALHFAVKGPPLNSNSQISIIELLLKYKADVKAKDIQGQTPLHLACFQSEKKILKLMESIICTRVDVEKNQLCDKITKIISKTEQANVVELLLKHKSDINARNISNETPIFYLYLNNRSKISNKKEYDDILKSVIEGFNAKRKEILKILLDHNADVNICNDIGQTILHVIASISQKFDDTYKEEVTELILNKGADVNAKTKYGTAPLHIAAKNGHSELIELLLKYKADINCFASGDQSTALHLATSYKQKKAIDILLKYKADVTATKDDGMNILHIMALMNPEFSEKTDFIESYDKIIKTFIECGCDINAQDINGRTPLLLASWEHNNAAIWAFMQHFADINIEDFAGETALSFPMNNTDRCVNIYCMFRDYVNMLKLTGLCISDKIDRHYFKLYRNLPDLKDDFLLQCREEIERMKSMRISSYVSLFDIIFKNSTEMEVYAGNEWFERVLKSDDFEKKFNIYSNLLKSQYRKGLKRKVLLKDAKDSLEFLIGFRLLDSCSERIFQYLDDKSLIDLYKAKILTTSKKPFNLQNTAYDQSEYASLEKALAYCKKLFDTQADMEIT